MQDRQLRRIAGLVRLFMLCAASYGLLYFSYKYYIPWSGGNDYQDYYAMYLRPLDFSAAHAPYVFRQLSALFTHAVYISGFYYHTEIWFKYPGHEQRVFFAALFSNYVCLVAAAWLTGTAVETLTRTRGLVYPMLAGLMCFLSFCSQAYVFTGLTEGVSWLLVAGGFVAYLQRRGWIVGVILLLAVLQRETIIIAFAVITAVALVLDTEQRRFNGRLLLWAVVCFALYVGMRKISGVNGNESQLDPQGIRGTLESFRITRELFFQGILSQNVLAIYVCLALACYRLMPEQRFWMPALLVALITLFSLGTAAGIGNNVGRICGILTPIFACFSTVALLRIEEALKGSGANETNVGEMC